MESGWQKKIFQSYVNALFYGPKCNPIISPMNFKSNHLALLLLFLLFWGCTTESNEKSTGALAIRLAAEPDRLLPPLTTSGYARVVHQNMYQYLLVQDPETFEYVPQLAKDKPEVEQIDENTTAYTYEIFQEASWDDGTPVTAEDYVFTLKTILNPKVPASRYRPYLAFIKDIKIDSENPKRFTVEVEGSYILAEDVINSITSILPGHLYDPGQLMTDIPFSTFCKPEEINQLAEEDPRLQQFAEQIQNPSFSRDSASISGSGPYQFKEWATGQQIVLQRKANWWGDQSRLPSNGLEAYPNQLTFKIVKDNASAIAALKAGELDVISRLQAQSFQELKTDSILIADYKFYTPVALETNYININTRNPKLDNPVVRRALAYSVNVDQIVREAQQGLATPSAGPVHPSASYIHPDLKPIPFNPDSAKSLLSQAGWEDTNGNGIVDKEIDGQLTELILDLLVSNSSQYLGILIQNHMKSAGIQINLVQKEFRAIAEDLRNGQYELGFFASALSPGLWDPSEQWHTQKGNNRTGFGNIETDALIDSLVQTLDDAKRMPMYYGLQEEIYEAQPCLWLYVAKGRVISHRRFEPALTSTFPNFEARLFRSSSN